MEAEEEQKPENEQPRTSPITESQFHSWKRQKHADASAKKAEAARKRAKDVAAGTVQMNGQELFLHEPWCLITLNVKGTQIRVENRWLNG